MRAIFVFIVLAVSGPAGAQDVGHIKIARGDVQLERSGQRMPVIVGMPVRQADTLLTGADGSVGVTFADNSLLSAGPGSALTIDRFAFDSTTHAGRFDTSLRRGTLAVISGKLVKQSPEAMRVRTPSSILGVRGTEFVVRVGGGG
jgi:hypothetical protein